MADRSIVARLRAETDQYKRDMADAAKATETVATTAEGAGKRGTSAFSSLAKSARENKAEWTQVGVSLGVVGGAVTALGAMTLRTGVAYNQLQQSSRAALTTLLGDAKAANAQMDRLDEFARSSPFAKQVFITAQQQMLGFGIAAQRVLPYLDAIQNAVAATGGSNFDISELSRIISQIHASAKITAVDLREFGNRGIDAATLIGSQMGKTGAEIRESITAGTLDAGEALDALAAGMEQRYGGAADNVKNTMVGALDRVKAAWRDLASEMAEPLVGKEGGGALVDAANGAADLMRSIQGLPGPVKGATAAAVGLTGALALAGSGFLLLVPRIIATKDALDRLVPSGMKASGVLKGLSVAAGAVTALRLLADTTAYLDSKLDRALPGAEAMATTLLSIDGSVSKSAAADIGDLAGALSRLDDPGLLNSIDKIYGAIPVVGKIGQELTPTFLGFGTASAGAKRDLREAEALVSRLDEAFTGLVAKGGVGQAQVTFEQLATAYNLTKDQQQQLLDQMPQYREALAGEANSAKLAGDATGDLADSTSEASRAFEDARTAAAQTGSAFVGLGNSLNDSKVSLGDWLKEMEAQAAALRDFTKNAQTAADKGLRKGLIQELAAAGPEGAMRMKQLADATDAELRRANRAWIGNQRAVKGWVDFEVPPKKIKVESDEAKQRIDSVQSALAALPLFKQINVRVNVPKSIRAPKVTGPLAGAIYGQADGGTVPGARWPYADKTLIAAAPGEEIISNRHGEADRFRADRAAGRIPAYADGGTVGGKGKSAVLLPTLDPSAFAGLDVKFPRTLAQWNAALEKSKAAVDKERQARDDLVAKRDQLSSSITEKLRSGLFDSASSDVWLSTSERQGSAVSSLFSSLSSSIANSDAWMEAQKALQAKGVNGGALEALLSQARGPQDLAAIAAMGQSDIQRYLSMYAQSTSKLTSTGMSGANAVYGQQVAVAQQQYAATLAQNNLLAQQNKALIAAIKANGDKNANQIVKALAGAAPKGKR